MFKTFIFGILLGIAAAVGLLYFVPAVDQHRETSLVSVEPNGGNLEAFHINLPEDRILAGAADSESRVPAALEWPATDVLANARVELFKIRDRKDTVIGVASRMTGPVAAQGSVVEWTLHLPARGTMYVAMQETTDADGRRDGSLRAGTREFSERHGSVNERFVDTAAAADDDSWIEGRIELRTALVRNASEVE